MRLQDIKEISMELFTDWCSLAGHNTELAFDAWLLVQEQKILDELDKLEPRYVKLKWSLAKNTKINPQLLTILLKKLRKEDMVMIMPICSETTGLASGSGYCLTSKNK